MSRPAYPMIMLREVCQAVEYGYTASAASQPIGPRFLRITDIVRQRLDWTSVPFCEIEAKRLKKYRLATGDIVIARTGATTGWAKFIKDPPAAVFASYLVRIRPTEAVDPRFLGHIVESNEYKGFIQRHMGGAAQPNANASTLTSFRFPLPPLTVQRRIAGILSTHDDLIENCERRIRVLDEMARALYRECFFARNRESTRVSAQQLIDDRVLEINDGYRAKNSELGLPGIPFARAGNIDSGFHFADADSLLESNIAKAGRKVSQPGDIVFTSKGTVGRFAIVRDRTPRFVYSPQLCFWRCLRREVLSPRYLFRWMQSREFLEQVDRVKGSTDMADYVSLTNQRRMEVRVPPAEVLQCGEALLGPIDEMVGNLTDRRDLARKTRDLLLPRLLSGQLSVADAA